MSQPLRAGLSIPPLENGDRLIRPEFEPTFRTRNCHRSTKGDRIVQMNQYRTRVKRLNDNK